MDREAVGWACSAKWVRPTPRRASNPTFSLNSGMWTLRYCVSLMMTPILGTAFCSKYRLRFGVHFIQDSNADLICVVADRNQMAIATTDGDFAQFSCSLPIQLYAPK